MPLNRVKATHYGNFSDHQMENRINGYLNVLPRDLLFVNNSYNIFAEKFEIIIPGKEIL